MKTITDEGRMSKSKGGREMDNHEIENQNAPKPRFKGHLLCYCGSLPGSCCDFCSGAREGTIDDYKSTLKWYRDGYDELASRCNVLEHRMGQISMILRDDVENKPIRDF